MQSGSLEGAMLLQKVECYTYFIYMNSSVNAELFFREVQLACMVIRCNLTTLNSVSSQIILCLTSSIQRIPDIGIGT
jgi:hypothetical protein